jgi:hypothetical protein
MHTPASTGWSFTSARAWLVQGRRRLYAAGALLAVVLIAILSLLPAGGVVSLTRMQELVDTAYKTSGTHCVSAAHARDLCHLKAEKCEGTLLVAPTSGGHFTIVSSTPEQLDSTACNKSEGGVAGFE